MEQSIQNSSSHPSSSCHTIISLLKSTYYTTISFQHYFCIDQGVGCQSRPYSRNIFIATIPVGSSSASEDQASPRQVVNIVSTSSTKTLTFAFHGTAMVASLLSDQFQNYHNVLRTYTQPQYQNPKFITIIMIVLNLLSSVAIDEMKGVLSSELLK